MGLSLHYELHDAGWATATVRDGERQVEFRVSYLHDSLRELEQLGRARSAG